jgi:hypothetical protein
MTLFPYCTVIVLCISTPGTTSAQKKDHCPVFFFGANEIGSVHVYGKKLITEMDYQGHTCTAMVGEE